MSEQLVEHTDAITLEELRSAVGNFIRMLQSEGFDAHLGNNDSTGPIARTRRLGV